MNFKGTFEDVVARLRDAPYLIFYDDEGTRSAWSYREFAADALRLAAFLKQRGVNEGGRVAIMSKNRPEVLLSYFACWLTGACACPVNVEESAERKAFILRRSACEVLLAETAWLGELDAPVQVIPIGNVLAEVRALEPLEPSHTSSERGAFLVYTSGTTGDPKGVLLSQQNLLANAQATADWHALGAGDGVMTVLPIHHVNGAVVTGLTSFLAGGRNILNRQFSPQTFWRRLASEKAVVASVVPTLLEFLLSADEDISRYDLSHLRTLLCGAGPLLSETVLRFEKRFGVPICHGFGMSETTAYNTQFPMSLEDDARRRWYVDYGFPSVGCALPCNEVAILKPNGEKAAHGEPGEIAVRGESVMAGYLDDSEANAKAFKHGWFWSGDQGFYELDESGRAFFFLSGRMKELIIRGGVNLSPLEIDEALRDLPGVAFALAFPFENNYYGEEVALYVVPEKEVTLTEEEVLAYAKTKLPFAKCPKVVLFGEEVPYTTTGKPKRLELAQQLAEDLAPYRTTQFREPPRKSKPKSSRE